MFIEGFLGYEYIRLELFDTPVPGLIGITLTTRSQNCPIFMQCQNLSRECICKYFNNESFLAFLLVMEVFICVFSICKPVYYGPNQVSNQVI